MTLKYMDFLNQLPVVGENILTTFKQKELILINVQIYDGVKMSTSQFIKLNNDLVNMVLPN